MLVKAMKKRQAKLEAKFGSEDDLQPLKLQI